ncbi:MAG TPA: MBL fold metallo-hydrolase [Actinomycetota bacterium]|nr:MBL fold metallo-hydrolase [Actinomycetota bacterium]
MSFQIFWQRAVGPLACNCYIVGDPDTKDALVIDPGGDADVIGSEVERLGLKVAAIIATHAHFDHVIASDALREATGAPFMLHTADRPLLDWVQESAQIFLGLELPPPAEVDTDASEGQRLAVGSVEIEVIHTPGHSPGSISLVAPDALFSGDTLFAGSVGRTDLPGGDTDALITAVRSKLFALPDDLAVHPGHGPATTIAREKASNPFVGDGASGLG